MELVVSPYLIAAASAWILAQFFKYLVASIKAKNMRQFRQFYLSGNMPSAHSATVVALATTIGLLDGTGTPLFALAALFAAVVMYDALMVRRSSGEQGAVLLQLLLDAKSKILPPRVAKGHTPYEVLAGALLGFVTGLVVFFATLG